MKKISSLLIAIMAIMSMATMGFAQTSATVTASATIVNELRLTADVFPVDSKNTDTYTDDTWGTTKVTTMAFGTLTHQLADGSEAGLLFSRPYYYIAMLGGFTSGRKYRIQSTCLGLVGSTGTLTKGFGVTFIDGDPKGSDGTTPINAKTLEQTTGTLGTRGTAVATNKVLYDSGTGGESRVITAYFGIPPYSSAGTLPGDLEPIPVDTPAGSFSGNVTFSIVLY